MLFDINNDVSSLKAGDYTAKVLNLADTAKKSCFADSVAAGGDDLTEEGRVVPGIFAGILTKHTVNDEKESDCKDEI